MFALAIRVGSLVLSVELDRDSEGTGESGDSPSDDVKPSDEIIPARAFRLGFALPEENQDDEHETEDTEE